MILIPFSKKRISFIALALVCFSATSNAQNPIDTDSIPFEITKKRVIAGFQIGANYSRFYNNSSPSEEAFITKGQGVRMGVQLNCRINDYFAILPRTELMFCNSKYKVTDDENITYESTMLPVSMQFMTHVQIRLPGEKWLPYAVVGPNLRVPVKSENQGMRYYGNKADLAADLGFGISRAFGEIIIAPEIRYSYGFSDINKNPFMEGVYHHQFCIMLNFTG